MLLMPFQLRLGAAFENARLRFVTCVADSKQTLQRCGPSELQLVLNRPSCRARDHS